MRNTIYVGEGPMFGPCAAVALPGTLIVVEDEEAASSMRRLVAVFGQKCLQAEVETNPEGNAKHARMVSVEVRTLAEVEQDEFNEKQAMEVL